MMPAEGRQNKPGENNTSELTQVKQSIPSAPTTVGVDDSGFQKAHFKVVQDSRFMEVAERSEIILPN